MNRKMTLIEAGILAEMGFTVADDLISAKRNHTAIVSLGGGEFRSYTRIAKFRPTVYDFKSFSDLTERFSK